MSKDDLGPLYSPYGAVLSSCTVGQLEVVSQSTFFSPLEKRPLEKKSGFLSPFILSNFRKKRGYCNAVGDSIQILLDTVSSAICQVGSREEMCRHSKVLHYSLSKDQRKPLM